MTTSPQLQGTLLIAGKEITGTQKATYAINPATNESLGPAYHGASEKELNKAAEEAWQAFDTYRQTPPETRAHFLESIAEEILNLGDTLVQRVMAESGLPQARVEGERGRTIGQLRLFANVVRAGKYLDVRIDPAMPNRSPLPRSDLRLQYIALGPVAVFGASNFPLAFSVAGGDTASALAAGCPVIAKAHPAHPGTSELIGRAIASAVKKCQLPAGVFSLLYSSSNEMSAKLVAHPYIKAVGFTGSRAGGIALMNIAATRKEPIPVYAEMSSINPVFIMPDKLATEAETLAKNFVGSLLMGAGQFCTNPGLVITLDNNQAEIFSQSIATEIAAQGTQTMLTPGIYHAYCAGVDKLLNNPEVTLVGKANKSDAPNQCQPHVFTTSAAAFLADPSLEEEIFGSTSLVIQCKSLNEYTEVAEHLEGQLTATIQMTDKDTEAVRALLPTLERKAGRILCNGYPTGVEVCHAMVHGGPFPATSDTRTTSVGSAAIDRFVRPVCYQDFPVSLQPAAIRDDNPLNIPQWIDGK